MSTLTATLRLDVRLQARSRLYAIGIFMAVLIGLLARVAFEPRHAARALPALYLLGLGGTTYIFGAAMVLLEKSEGTLQALRATPLTSNAYIASKVITLGAFALLEGLVIYAVGFFGVSVHPAPLLLGVVCLGVVNTLVSMGQVASHDSLTSFLIPGAMVVSVVLQWPVFHVVELGPPLSWYLIPTQGPLLLMMAGFRPLAPWQWVYAITVSMASIGLAGWWARARFARFIMLQEG